jgi:hypothetical protein
MCKQIIQGLQIEFLVAPLQVHYCAGYSEENDIEATCRRRTIIE